MSSSTRFFITAGTEHWQLFTFEQNKTDGSIYVSLPDFTETKWLTFHIVDGYPRFAIRQFLYNGKISLHSSGQVHVRPYSNPPDAPFIIKGHPLKSDGVRGVRHLMTSFIAKPKHLPTSPAFNRKSDHSVQVSELRPIVFIFWAIPSRNISINLSIEFEDKDIEIPPPVGVGTFQIGDHFILWATYRTKLMERWPKNTHISYHDGFAIPVFIGGDIGDVQGQGRLELRKPLYQIENDELHIAVTRACIEYEQAAPTSKTEP